MRTPVISGTWHDANGPRLAARLDGWRSIEPLPGTPAVIIVPHAGYTYSGALAAGVYSRLPAGAYDQAIILAPSHYAALPAQCSPEPAGEVATPLGPVVFDQSLHDQLAALPGARYLPAAHGPEHSIDIQLPLIRHFLPGCRLGALLVGQWRTGADDAPLRRCAVAFRALLGPRTLVIVSTDFTHYGPRFGFAPFAENAAEHVRRLDEAVFGALATNSDRVFAEVLRRTRATVCGASALRLLLACLPQTATFTRLAYDTSGRSTGDWTNFVTYLGAMIEADWTQPPKAPEAGGATTEGTAGMAAKAGSEEPRLSPQAAAALLKLARAALETAVRREPAVELEQTLPPAVRDELQALRGAFVTLTAHGRLRGCIGEILPRRPLAQVVRDRARSAALEDPRFRPVRPEELAEIDLEVSVLTPPVQIASWHDIELGRHGIILHKYGQSAVFLPQVAPEQGWDLPTTLTHLALKAGLPAEAWRDGARFEVFTAQILH